MTKYHIEEIESSDENARYIKIHLEQGGSIEVKLDDKHQNVEFDIFDENNSVKDKDRVSLFEGSAHYLDLRCNKDPEVRIEFLVRHHLRKPISEWKKILGDHFDGSTESLWDQTEHYEIYKEFIKVFGQNDQPDDENSYNESFEYKVIS